MLIKIFLKKINDLNFALVLLGILVHSNSLLSQPFNEVTSITMPGVHAGTMDWADFDNDGDLDFLLTGDTSFSGNYITILYRNEGNGSFSIIETGIPGIGASSIDWGDYDNDGDLDILLMGLTSWHPNLNIISKVYKNEGSTGAFSWNFVDIGLPLEAMWAGHVNWADFDNDGDLDIFMPGTNYTTRITKIYSNNGNDTFSDTGVELVGVFGMANVGDFDNDGDIDIFMAGRSIPDIIIPVIYVNEGRYNFTEIKTNIKMLETGSSNWGDYDNDGDLDLLITGISGDGSYSSKIYKNNGFFGGQEWVFTDINASLDGVWISSAEWGDCDNDGDLDIVLSGNPSGGYSSLTKIYRNDGSDTFSDINANLFAVFNSSVSWGDFDNDSDLDLLLLGMYSGGGHISKLYRNDGNNYNSVPGAPIDLSVINIYNNSATLTWTPPEDDTTPQQALTYNLRVGTSPGGIDIISPNSNLINGYRKIVRIGNTNFNTVWRIERLQQGVTYYWNVQAIDNTYAGSQFSLENTFNLNRQPIAFAGNDTTIECTSCCTTEVTLDGSGSTDPDGDPLTYTWRENGKIISGPTSASQSTVTLSLSDHLIELTADDGKGGTDTDEVLFTVEDTTPPELTAEFIPVDVEEDEGTFTIQYSVTDICDPSPNMSAVIILPALLEPKIEFKVKKHKKLKIDLKKNKVKVEGPDPQGFWAEVQSAGGIPVNNGQEMEIKVKDKHKYEYKFDDNGNLEKIKSPKVTLLCTATDASGNVASATASPTFESEDEDGLEKIISSDLVESSVPDGFCLFQNYPNPFNPETEIRFQLPKSEHVNLTIYNTLGQKIRTLADKDFSRGYHTIQWNGKDEFGNTVSGGLYLCKIQTNNYQQTIRMLFLK